MAQINSVILTLLVTSPVASNTVNRRVVLDNLIRENCLHPYLSVSLSARLALLNKPFATVVLYNTILFYREMS